MIKIVKKINFGLILFFLLQSSSFGETVSLESASLQRKVKIQVSLPEDYHTGAFRYPVVIVFDGAGYFDLVSKYIKELNRYFKIPELIVIGVDNTNRFDEFVDSEFDSFFEFVDKELPGYIKKNYRVQEGFIGVGHSLGASFIIRAINKQPDLFNSVSISSPLIAKRSGLSIDIVKNSLCQLIQNGGQVFLAKGNEVGIYEKTIPHLNELINNDNFIYKEFPSESHASIPLIAPYFGISLLFEGYIPTFMGELAEFDTLEELSSVGGYKEIKSYYLVWSKKKNVEFNIPEIVISRLAFIYAKENISNELRELFDSEALGRSYLIYHVSKYLRNVGNLEDAYYLLNLDHSINRCYELNRKLMKEVANEMEIETKNIDLACRIK